MRVVLRAVALASAAAFALSGCADGGSTVDVFSEGGWPGRFSDARNSSTATAEGLGDVSAAWDRPLGGTVGSPAAIAANGQISVTASTEGGCNLFSFQIDNGRKRWCTRLAPGATTVTPVSDGVANVYVGEDGGMFSFNEHGQRRWRIPVSGTPRSAQFASDGKLVVVTHFGQVNIIDPQTGRLVAPLFDLIPVPGVGDGRDVPRLGNDHGLPACFGGSPDCPVATTPAVDLSTDRIFVTLWRPGADRAALVAMRYTSGDTGSVGDAGSVTEEWSTGDLPGGAVTSPVLSADGATVYVHDGDGTLWAVDSSTGAPRWSHPLDHSPATGPAVTNDGLLLIAAGGGQGSLLALRDNGDGAETVWERTDVTQRGVTAVTSDGQGYTIVDGSDGLTALVFDTSDGRTLDEEPLSAATGFPVGTAVGPDGEFVTTTHGGDVVVLR